MLQFDGIIMNDDENLPSQCHPIIKQKKKKEVKIETM